MQHASEAVGRPWRGVAFRLAARDLVVPLPRLREVRQVPRLARVPGTRVWMVGVANVNGRLLPVADLARYFLGRPRRAGADRALVVERDGFLSGLLVDEILGVRDFSSTEGREPQGERGERGTLDECVAGVCPSEDGTWELFDLDALLDRPDFADAREAGS